jgi:amino acid transporter
LMVGIISAYAKLNSLQPSSGAAFEWASKELGKVPGFFTGWAVLMASCLFLVSAVLPAGEATVLLFSPSLAKNKILTGGVGLIWLTVIFLIVNRGIETVGKFQMVISGLELALLGFIAYATLRVDSTVSMSSLLAFDIKTLPQGITLAVFMYWGWDVIFNASEKTKNTQIISAHASRIAITTLALLFSLFAFIASQTMSAQEIAASEGNMLFALADKALPKPWSTFAVLTFLLSTIGAIEASMVQFSQTLLAKARKQVLPARLSVLSAIGAAINASSIWVAFYYGMAAISCAKYFSRSGARTNLETFTLIVLPIFSATVLFVALGLSMMSLQSESIIAIGVTFIVGGICYLAIRK